MALIDTLTPNRGYPLPAGANNLADDVLRLILAIGAIDSDVAAALTSLASVAPKANPIFTGTPEAPTPVAGDDSNRLATTAFVKAAFDLLVAAAPGALDTLNELAAALGNDPDFATTVTNALAGKADGAATTAALATKANADATTAALAEKADAAATATALAGKLAKAGDTMTGLLTFLKAASSGNLLVDLMQGYGIYSDNTGPGAANNRMWFAGPNNGAMYFGPRAGGEKLHSVQFMTDDIRDRNSQQLAIYSGIPSYMAVLGAGAVGTYALAQNQTGSAQSQGANFAGSNLRYSQAAGIGGAFLSGSWKLMGYVEQFGAGVGRDVSLFVRYA